MVIHKSTFFGKTPSPIWVKMAQIMLKDPLKMSYKSWLTCPLKNLHGPKNEIFGNVQSSDVLQEYKSFLALSDHFGTFWGYFGLVLGLNLKLSQTSHVTTQNDRKRSRNPMDMVSEVNFKMLRSFQDHLGPFEAFIGLFLGLNL